MSFCNPCNGASFIEWGVGCRYGCNPLIPSTGSATAGGKLGALSAEIESTPAKLISPNFVPKATLYLSQRATSENAQIELIRWFHNESLARQPVDDCFVVGGGRVVAGRHFIERDDFALADAFLELGEVAHLESD